MVRIRTRSSKDMASREHYDILRKQEDNWKNWQQSHPRIDPQRLWSLPQAELDSLNQKVFTWNSWREMNPDLQPDLRGCYLNDTDLRYANLERVNLDRALLARSDLRKSNLCQASLVKAFLHGANLDGAYLTGADLREADLSETSLRVECFRGANLSQASFGERLVEGNTQGGAHLAKINFNEANLSAAYLFAADLYGADLSGADLSRTTLTKADLSTANLEGANLQDAHLYGVNFTGTNLSRANLSGADMRNAQLVKTDLRNANLSGCRVYGISAWDVKLEKTNQSNLIITLGSAPTITVDNLEVAQFIYLLLNNQKLRDVIDTVGRKAVLILGRFTSERKAVLDAIRESLRERGYLPIVFDFDAPSSRDLTETVSTLAHLSRFIIADITDAQSIPQELQAIVPHLPSVPIQPLILASQHEYGMFEHFKRYHWVLETYFYNSIDELLTSLSATVIEPAESKANELRPNH
jgi:uncharacterized protein YjbI with pentapeptide repeats